MITIKTPAEIAILKEGGKRHALILSRLSEKIKPGASTQDLENFAIKLIEEGGDIAAFLNYTPKGARRPYPAALCVSINNEIVHGIPNETPRILEEGDIVSLDLGLIHQGLITDSAVTIPVGKVSKEDKKLISDCKEALNLGIKVALGSGFVGDISHAIGEFARSRGYGICQGLSGHGVGYKVHEDPYVPNEGRKGGDEKLKPGMVIAIEPMMTLGTDKIVLSKDGYTYKTADGSNAAHFEHTIAITDGAPIILTK